MLFSISDDLALCREFKLSPKQLMFMKMLVRDYSLEENAWQKKSYAMTMEFQQLCPLSAEELSDLFERNFIVNLSNKPGKIYYEYLEINSRYSRQFSLAITGMPTELHEEYPYEIINGDFRFFSKDANPEQIGPAYLKAINKNQEEHELVMDDLRWAKEKNLLPVGLKKFVDSKYWLHLRELRKKVAPKNITNGKLG